MALVSRAELKFLPMPSGLTWSLSPTGRALSSYHRAAAASVLVSSDIIVSDPSCCSTPACVEKLLDGDGTDDTIRTFVVLAWSGERCVAGALFAAGARECGAQLILIASVPDARRHGIGRAMVRFVRHACCRLLRSSRGGANDGVLASQQLSTVIPREGFPSQPHVRRFFRALGFASARGTDASGLICAFDTEKTTVLCCPLAAESADVTSANDLAALLALTRFGGSHSADDDGEEADDEEEDEDGLEDRAEGEEGAVAPAVGSVLALWRTQEQRHWPCVVTDRMAVLAHSGKRGRATGEQHSLRVRYLADETGAMPAQRAEKLVDGWTLRMLRAGDRQTHTAEGCEREARAAREPVGGGRAKGRSGGATSTTSTTTASASGRAPPCPSANGGRSFYFLSVPPSNSADWRRYLAESLGPERKVVAAEAAQVRAQAAARVLAAAAVKAAEAARGGKASKGDDASMDAATAAAVAAAPRRRRSTSASAAASGSSNGNEGSAAGPSAESAEAAVTAPPPPPPVEAAAAAEARGERPPRKRKSAARPSIPKSAWKVDVHATPPIPPTPESPARPIWWRDGEDDERAAEMLYLLFRNESGESLARELGDWVYRDTELQPPPIASEAFPHVEFWRELDIRWVRYSCAHAGVAEALKRLKTAFARGEGKLKHVSVDGDKAAAGGGGRQKRARRGAGGKGGEDDATGGRARHPLQQLSGCS